MSKWKDEDIATPALIKDYLEEFREGIINNSRYQLDEKEKWKVLDSLEATEKFCSGMLLEKRRKLYMHDLILMAIGFYGGYLTALEA